MGQEFKDFPGNTNKETEIQKDHHDIWRVLFASRPSLTQDMDPPTLNLVKEGMNNGMSFLSSTGMDDIDE